MTMHDGTYQIIVTMDHGWQSENGCLYGEDWENGWKDHTQKRLFWGFSPSFIKTKKIKIKNKSGCQICNLHT